MFVLEDPRIPQMFPGVKVSGLPNGIKMRINSPEPLGAAATAVRACVCDQ